MMVRKSQLATARALAHEKRIVLCMIVKNEAHIIERCLNSALPHVDAYVISDTGSSDGTATVIAGVAARLGKPGQVVCSEWRNFGHNRTLAARAARAWVDGRGWPRADTYLLFLDADMVLEVAPTFHKARLVASGYQLIQDNGSLRYSNLRLACLSQDWCAIGATHEYWKAEGDAAQASALETMSIRDVGDGGSKADKTERDIRLLKEAVEKEPGDARSVFYLAQSYFDAGQWDQALGWYARRRQLGGWSEELWYALFRQGMCLLRLGEAERGAGVLLEAFEERPTRAEPLHALARFYRERGRNRLAALFAVRALELPCPDDTLFVHQQVYQWQLWEEIMISGYYEPKYRDLGFGACERLLARRAHSATFYEYVARNETFYLPPHPVIRRGRFDVPSAWLEEDSTEFHPTNPCIAQLADRTWVNVRLVNYRQTGGHDYVAPGDGVIRTRNLGLEWNRVTGQIESTREVSGMPPLWPQLTRIRGFEDVRWIEHQGRLWFTATCHQVPGAADRCRVVLGRMNQPLDAVEHVVPLSYAGAREVEKNWLPWSVAGELLLIYGYEPLTVLSVNLESGETRVRGQSFATFRAERFRGSGAPVPMSGRAGRWLALVHEVARRDAARIYAHRWVELDVDAGLSAYSRPFVFDHMGVEYAAGLLDNGDGTLTVTYGYEDREARWAMVEWASVISSLRASE
jgi:tetratricopeptide (TPR) repeat protein